MKKTVVYIVIILIISFQLFNSLGVQRFPRPEFESGYVIPQTVTPEPRSQFLAILDVGVLIFSLSVITWLVLKKRSRNGVFWMSIFSILYFGFFREGCVCSVGSVQNVTLALFNPEYSIPITVIAFFIIPLIFTLFFGRTFCAGVCPLGAIQDIVAFKPLPLKAWLQKVLGLLPFIYLGLSVLYAATSTDFVICRYDPFIGIYRFNATFPMFLFGAILLVTGVFIARPYCRFLCPYRVLLNLISRVSWRHLTITPSNCIQCRLCEDSCPFGAIDKPVSLKEKDPPQVATRRLILFSLIIPLLILIGGYVGSSFHENLARVNHKVQLSQQLLNPEGIPVPEPVEIAAFKSSGEPVEDLYKEAAAIVNQFYIGGWILGGFIGLVFGLTLAGLSIFRYRTDYEPNKGNCLSCARCVDYCPIKKE